MWKLISILIAKVLLIDDKTIYLNILKEYAKDNNITKIRLSCIVNEFAGRSSFIFS